uniref:SKA complex subunit 1 n=1 Tax=Neovison vison TaxID=452646 RepID=A0A8C7BWY8_NEOVI
MGKKQNKTNKQTNKNPLVFPVVSKYKILHQPKQSMTSMTLNQLSHPGTPKSHYFTVEAHIKELTALKADTWFHVIMSILPHCWRLSEVRLFSYVINL